MRSAADYRRFADECRRLAAVLTAPADKRALELMASGWDKTADDCEAKLTDDGDLIQKTDEPQLAEP